MDKTINKHFCIQPFINVTTRITGNHNVCCNTTFKDSNIKFIKNLKEKKNYYNLIIFSHTIAYTDDIEKLIILIKSLLKNDGTLFFNIQDTA